MSERSRAKLALILLDRILVMLVSKLEEHNVMGEEESRILRVNLRIVMGWLKGGI